MSSKLAEQQHARPKIAEEQLSGHHAVIDLGSIVGALSSACRQLLQTMTDILASKQLNAANLFLHRTQANQSYNAVESRRSDGSVLYTYDTDAQIVLDNQDRILKMRLPGPNGQLLSLAYEGSNVQPSSVDLCDGTPAAIAGDTCLIQVNRKKGLVNIVSAELSAHFFIKGQSWRALEKPAGAHSFTFYDHADRSNTTRVFDKHWNMCHESVQRADGSGHIIEGSQLKRSKFAPGTTNCTYTDLSNGRKHMLRDIEQIDYIVSSADKVALCLRTRGGRMFVVTDPQTGSNDQCYATKIEELGRRRKSA